MYGEFNKTIQMIRDAQRVAVLTGAGISTLSGIPDFSLTQDAFPEGGAA